MIGPLQGSQHPLQNFEAIKRQILDRIDILDLVSEHVALKRQGKRWVGLCVFHSEKTPSFTVSPELGIFKCFGCGKGGDIFAFVRARENVSFMEAMNLLADRAGVDLDRSYDTNAGTLSRADLGKVNAWALRFFQSNLRHQSAGQGARAYLRDRGFEEPVVERFGVGLACVETTSLSAGAARAGIEPALLFGADLMRKSDDGRSYDTFRNRLMFPIRDATSRIVGFGGRTLANETTKYLNTRQNSLFDKGRVLFGIDVAREAISKTGRAVIVEGYTDCMAAHQAGFLETVATLGTALTEAHVDMLRRYCHEIILLFDSDEAGEAAADRAIGVALPRCVGVRLARIPDGKDPCDYLGRANAGAFSDVLKKAVDALEFKWTQTLARFGDSASGVGRRDAIMDFLGFVAKACSTEAVDEIQRGQFVLQVAGLLRMDGNEVNRLMSRLRVRASRRSLQSIGTTQSARIGVPFDGEHAAWINLLEVVLNDSEHLQFIEDLPDTSRIFGDTDRRIAIVVMDLAATKRKFELSDVLARFRDETDVRRVTELAERGAIRGNFEATFQMAMERMRKAGSGLEMEQPKRALRESDAQQVTGDEGRSYLARIHRSLAENPHPFSGRRLIRPALGTMQAAVENKNQTQEIVAKVEQS